MVIPRRPKNETVTFLQKKKFKDLGSHDLFKREIMNKKETKIPAKSKLENKSLRQKLGHPAGLPN